MNGGKGYAVYMTVLAAVVILLLVLFKMSFG
jgi:uncharacterized membrane protein